MERWEQDSSYPEAVIETTLGLVRISLVRVTLHFAVAKLPSMERDKRYMSWSWAGKCSRCIELVPHIIQASVFDEPYFVSSLNSSTPSILVLELILSS
jgi:hypothetical protein